MFMFALSVFAQQSGACGENLTWTLENGTLTISGTGAMTNYMDYGDNITPWHSYSSSSSIISITIADGVTSIGDYAFEHFYNLTSVTIPNSVTSIGDRAFSNCYRLPPITIPNSVTSIGSGAFSGCRSLTSVTIPNNVTSIGSGPFSGCMSLTSIKVDASHSTYCDIDGVLFNKDKTILVQYPAGKTATSYTIPNSVTSIGDRAFKDCSSLISVTIPNSVTSIGDLAFKGCSSLISVTIPNSVTSIGNSAFSCCNSLTSVTIPNNVTSIGSGAFSGCRSLTSVTIPNSVTSIGNYTFRDCNLLTSVTIPNSVTSIGERTFYGCWSLKSVVLGSSVEVLEGGAFSGCYAIETITCYNMRPPTLKINALNGLSHKTIIYVLADSYETYYNHDVWGLYDVRPIEGKSVETEEVQVTPSDNSADIVWPVVTGAATYELVIREKDDNTVCTLVFNDKWQLTSIAFSAPSRGNVPDNVQTAGFSFTVTRLEAGTTYNYTLTAKDSGNGVIDTKHGTFKTKGTATGIEEADGENGYSGKSGKDGISGTDSIAVKVLRDGVTYIVMPDGRMYDLQGKEVR